MKTLFLALALIAPSAYAQNCSFDVNGEEANLSVDTSVTPVKAILKVGNVELRQVGVCGRLNVPGRGALRCTFGDAKVRVEVYPGADAVKVIIWNKGQPSQVTGSCQN